MDTSIAGFHGIWRLDPRSYRNTKHSAWQTGAVISQRCSRADLCYYTGGRQCRQNVCLKAGFLETRERGGDPLEKKCFDNLTNCETVDANYFFSIGAPLKVIFRFPSQ